MYNSTVHQKRKHRGHPHTHLLHERTLVTQEHTQVISLWFLQANFSSSSAHCHTLATN